MGEMELFTETYSCLSVREENCDEIKTAENEVAPGLTFCRSNRKYYPNGEVFKTDASSCLKYKIQVFSREQLAKTKLLNCKISLAEDLSRLNCHNTFFVHGSKIREIRGSNIVAHDLRHTVVAVNYKSFVHMLLTFSNKLEDGAINKISESLHKVLYENSECFIPDELLKSFSCAYIYKTLSSTAVMIKDIKESMTNYCHLLQDSSVSEIPQSVIHRKSNQLASHRLLVSGKYGIEYDDSSIAANGLYEKGSTEKNSDQQSAFHKTTGSIEKSLVPSGTGYQTQVYNSNIHQANYHYRDVQDEHLESPGQWHQTLASIRSIGCFVDFMNDSDISTSMKGKINSKDLQEANGRSQNIVKFLKTEKDRYFETRENLRSVLAQNEKDFSTQSHRKENTSSKIIESHIINQVKSQKDSSGMERKFYGNFSSKFKEKVVILLGASGSGKTTLVNFIVNYFQGAKAADDMQVYVDANSGRVKPTTTITAYTFCTDETHAPITVIDTPGLNDSSREERNDNIQSIKQFLTNAASHKIDIHAIGFVVQAHLVRLTSSEQLILEYVSSLFGQSVTDHLITFVTAADNQEIPPVVETMRNFDIKSKTFFKFNNSAIRKIVQEMDDLDRLYWRMGCKSWKKFLKLLLDLPQLSVNTFKALQSKVYAGKVIESAARGVKEELKNFINLCKDHQDMTKEAFEKCEQVWELASVFNHLKCTQESGVSDVESILKTYAIEVCMDNSFNSNECIDLLFLGRSKGLFAAGMGVISSMGPLYEHAKKYSNPKQYVERVPSILHCIRCEDDHQITRSSKYSGIMSYISGLGKSRENITFKCTKCDCDGSLHKEIPIRMSKASFDLSSELLLKNTKIVITELLQERSQPGYVIKPDKYLHLINIALDCKFQILIEDLLKS
nr:uncharacterized protein LOC123747151 [Procambarus clarkii]